jgi:NAD(P)-dependent dehydrogenase (short-subunit alcohol dehydrogenase family)
MNVMDFRQGLQGKTIFVTGGLGGIGRAAVEAFLENGARVAFTYALGKESPSDAQALADQVPDRTSMHALDLMSIETIRNSMSEALSRWGRLDVLINNAAVGSATVSSYASDTFSQDSYMFLINADGALKVCQTFIEKTELQEGWDNLKIINVSSVGGGMQVFPKFRLSDGMSKAGVAFMTRQLAAELVHRDIDVFALCPGATRTKMLTASTLDLQNETDQDEFLARLPKGRLIEPREIANIMVFLASQYSTAMHGAVIDASMGLGVRPGVLTEY